MSTFFKLYHEFTKRGEPPANFHAWTAIATISALLGKKCFIPQGHFTVYPNTYIVLVGPPGVKKSTAMNIGKQLVRSVKKVPVAPESSTREALIDDMSANKVQWSAGGVDVSYNQSTAFVGELEQFFGGKHINQQMVGFLTAIWDEPVFKERTRKGGEVIINNPYFTLLGCCTPDWMNTKLKQDVISDGFSRRAIFVLESEPNGFVPWPEFSDMEADLKTQLEKEALRILNITGRFRYTQPAFQYWCDQYRKIRNDMSGVPEKLQHYFSSKHILAMKLSMCLSAATRSDRIVDSACLKMAFRFLEVTETKMEEVFAGVGRNELKGYTDRMLKRIQKSGESGVSHAELLRLCNDDMTLTEFKESLQVLMESGHVSAVPQSATVVAYRFVGNRSRQERVNLLELAQTLSPVDEPLMEGPSVSPQELLVDPNNLRRAAQSELLRKEQLAGILYRGNVGEWLRNRQGQPSSPKPSAVGGASGKRQAPKLESLLDL